MTNLGLDSDVGALTPDDVCSLFREFEEIDAIAAFCIFRLWTVDLSKSLILTEVFYVLCVVLSRCKYAGSIIASHRPELGERSTPFASP
jgi:hypothetical protein